MVEDLFACMAISTTIVIFLLGLTIISIKLYDRHKRKQILKK